VQRSWPRRRNHGRRVGPVGAGARAGRWRCVLLCSKPLFPTFLACVFRHRSGVSRTRGPQHLYPGRKGCANEGVRDMRELTLSRTGHRRTKQQTRADNVANARGGCCGGGGGRAGGACVMAPVCWPPRPTQPRWMIPGPQKRPRRPALPSMLSVLLLPSSSITITATISCRSSSGLCGPTISFIVGDVDVGADCG
jgi:hypothetical protein